MKFRAIELFFVLCLFCYMASTTNALTVRTIPASNKDPTSSDFNCPTGELVITKCNDSPCPNNEICYQGPVQKVCCPRHSFCFLTNMYSYFDRQDEGQVQVFKYQYTTQKADFLYEDRSPDVNLVPGCPLPVSLLLIEKYKANTNVQILPVDFEQLDQSEKLKTCTKNSDCADNAFCGDVYNPSNEPDLKGRDEQNIKFCYEIPSVPTLYKSATKYTKRADKHNLIACDSHDDCYNDGDDATSFCYKNHGHKTLTYFVQKGGVYEKMTKEGLCMTSKICVAANKPSGIGDFKWELAGAPPNGVSCNVDADCGGGGKTRASLNPTNIIYNPHCIKQKALGDINLCCYEIIPQCSPGETETPPIFCDPNNQTAGETGFEKCNAKFEVLKQSVAKQGKWCDKSTNQCCKDIQNQLQWCDDGDTPLFNEPECTEYDPAVVNSGNCEREKGATCKYGHCCPKVKVDPANNNIDHPDYTYRTNYPCTPGKRPELFQMGYCDPKTEKVIIIGKRSAQTGDPLTHFPRNAPKVCVIDSDCSADNSTLCLYMNAAAPKCFYNPMLELQRDANAVWMGVLITSIILAFVFLATSVCCMVLYRSKSVFDKYKPSKKKGGKKSGSKSKSSKKSKEGASETKSVTESKKSVMQ